nr:MAG TPA: hypothetical protein [Caudoviricetes sp.]
MAFSVVNARTIRRPSGLEPLARFQDSNLINL